MDITVESMQDNKAKLKVTVEAATVDAKLKGIYKDFANRYNFPGFRKGRAPRPVIDNAIGRDAILASATEEIINAAYPEVIEIQKLYPAGSPDFGDTDSVIAPGKDFTFEFTLDLKPTYELSSYDPVEIEIPPLKATDKNVEDQIEIILNHYKEYKDAPANTKLSGDRAAVLDIVATDEEGGQVDVLTTEGLEFHEDSAYYPADFAKEVAGIKKGEERSFDVEVDDDDMSIFASEIAGKKIHFEVKCQVIRTQAQPKLTDEWVKENFDADSVDAFKEEIRDSITAQNEKMAPNFKETKAALEIAGRLQGDVPDNVAEQVESELLQNFFTQLQAAGMTFDTYLANAGIDNKQFKEDVKEQALDQAKQELALDAWAAHYGIEADEADIQAEFVNAGVENPVELQAQWRESGRLYLIREGVVRAKAMDDILEKAIVKEVDPSEQVEENDSEKKEQSE